MPSARLCLERAFAIQACVTELLREAGVRHPPVSTDLLHRLHPELRVQLAPLGSLSSALRLAPDQERAEIYVNEAHSVVRQRFSIAHEYGHYVLHTRHALRAYGLEAAVLPDLREQEADFFASHLLVPLAMLDAWAPLHDDEANQKARVAKLASRFNVSQAVARLALQRLAHARQAI